MTDTFQEAATLTNDNIPEEIPPPAKYKSPQQNEFVKASAEIFSMIRIPLMRKTAIIVLALFPLAYFSFRSIAIESELDGNISGMFLDRFFSDPSILFFCVTLLTISLISSLFSKEKNPPIFLNIIKVVFIILLCMLYADFRFDINGEVNVFTKMNIGLWNGWFFAATLTIDAIDGFIKNYKIYLEEKNV